MSYNVARHLHCSTALLHISHGITASQWICRAPARDTGKAKSYQFAPVTIGNGCTIDVRAGVSHNTNMEPGSSLGALSWLHEGEYIPTGERWDGVPAQKVGMTEPATANARGQSIDPVKHALLTLLSLWLQTTISALPWMALTYLYIDAPVNPQTNPFAFLLFVLVGAPACVITGLIAQALSLRLLARTRPGAVNRWSAEYVCIWAKSHALERACLWLSGTLFWPTWLRIAGMIDRNSLFQRRGRAPDKSAEKQ